MTEEEQNLSASNASSSSSSSSSDELSQQPSLSTRFIFIFSCIVILITLLFEISRRLDFGSSIRTNSTTASRTIFQPHDHDELDEEDRKLLLPSSSNRVQSGPSMINSTLLESKYKCDPKLIKYKMKDAFGRKLPSRSRPQSCSKTWKTRLFTPTYVTQALGYWWIVDCWHHRVLYRRRMPDETDADLDKEKDFERGWKKLNPGGNESLLRIPHSLATDGRVIVVESSIGGSGGAPEDHSILVFEPVVPIDVSRTKKSEKTMKWIKNDADLNFDDFRLLQVVPACHPFSVSRRPHRIIYDSVVDAFFLWLTTPGALARFDRVSKDSNKLKLSFCRVLKSQITQYARSITIGFGGDLIITTSPMLRIEHRRIPPMTRPQKLDNVVLGSNKSDNNEQQQPNQTQTSQKQNDNLPAVEHQEEMSKIPKFDTSITEDNDVPIKGLFSQRKWRIAPRGQNDLFNDGDFWYFSSTRACRVFRQQRIHREDKHQNLHHFMPLCRPMLLSQSDRCVPGGGGFPYFFSRIGNRIYLPTIFDCSSVLSFVPTGATSGLDPVLDAKMHFDDLAWYEAQESVLRRGDDW